MSKNPRVPQEAIMAAGRAVAVYYNSTDDGAETEVAHIAIYAAWPILVEHIRRELESR